MLTVLTEAKRKELLEAYLRARPENGRPEPSAAPVEGDHSLAPLTFAQKQLWLHAQFAPGTSLYNEPLTVRRHGPLEIRALERSFSEIIRRHEAWRTRFPVINGEPMQKIGEPFEIRLPLIDLRDLPVAKREKEGMRIAAEDAGMPFDLATGPLIRAKLVRLEEDDYRLFVTLHHLIFDGYSGYRVFLPELVELYEAFSQGKPSPLPQLPYQFADYASWQEEWEGGEALGVQMEYWRRRLSGDLPTLQLPISRSRSGAANFRGAMRSLSLPVSLSESLRRLSAQEGATLYMTLLAGFNVLLRRYSGQEDILIGSNTAGRNHPGSEKLLGYFLNTIVLRTDLTGRPTFRQLLSRVRQTTLDALSNQEAPLDQLVAQLHPQRDVKRNPLFQVLFSLEPQADMTAPGWDITCIDVETGTTKFELCLVLDDRADGLLCRFIYNTDLFEAAAIERMAAHWRVLLEGIVSNPGLEIDNLPVLPDEERHRLLVEWNDAAQSDELSLVHELFAEQAEKTPDTVAVRCGGAKLTYDELNKNADELADYLRTLGVGRNIPVALCVERSVEMILGILAILKAGGAYVPIDPTYPRERIKFMIADCGADVLLTNSKLAQSLFASRPFAAVRNVLLDSNEWRGSGPVNTGLEASFVDSNLESLAYVIYTSGSTGGPKGVEITHRNLAHSNGARLKYYGNPVGKFLLLSSFGFDSSIVGIFHTLTTGGTLVIPPADEFHWTAEELAKLVAENQISHILTFPSLYGDLLEHADGSTLASLCSVIVAGEACPRSLVDNHYRILPQASLFNEYGPTEDTVWATVYECEPGGEEAAVPIGRPIANTQVFVLDHNQQPAPIGIPGELYIGGDGVARGYRNRPELTDASFIPNPLTPKPGSRLYRTGDLVRYRDDGNLEFLGRVDQQVKVRGLRIELGEIETALTSYPDVREAAVVAQSNGSADPSLVAFVVAQAEHATSSQELRAFLKNRLPTYMVPTVFHFLKNFPRTPNGKVDRQALIAQGNGAEVSAHEAIGPRNEVEKRLLAIWQRVLGTTSQDVTEDFFELGGHSLLAARLLSRIEKEFGRSLSLAFVFQSPTVEQMAESLLTAGRTLRERAIIPIQPTGSLAPLFWVRGGPRFRLLAQKLAGDRPLLGLDLPFTDGSRLPVPYRFEDIATLLIRAMREVQPKGPYYIAGLCVNAVIAYEIAQQLVRDGEEVALLAMLDAHNQAYYKNPFKDGRYTARVRYHLSNLLKLDAGETSTYLMDRLDEARRKIERVAWRLVSDHSGDDKLHNTDSIVHPAFSRYEPQPYSGNIVLFQSSEWPKGPYFDFELGWKDLVSGGIESYAIPGDHPSMFLEPNVNLVAEKISSHLEETVPRRS
ncbi:MAG TPA: amino acid adenylation domain-containing protein [Candidatus Sulfotelmatobacter sp.]|jgi:aspartate racemase